MKLINFFGRRFSPTFCFFFFSKCFLFAQDIEKIACRQIQKINTGKLSINREISSFISPPFIYYYTEDEWDPENRILKIYSINCTSQQKDSFTLSLPDDIVINYLPEIALNADYLILTDDEYSDSYRYKYTKGKYEFLNKIILPENFDGRQKLILNNNCVLLYSLYNHHPSGRELNTNLGIYDAENDRIIKTIHPDLPCIAFSHLVNSWVSANDKFIACAYPCGFKILLFDHNLSPIDTISYDSLKNWKDLPANKIPFETDPAKVNIKLLIDQLLILQDTVSRIEKIHFVNKTTLMVTTRYENCGKNNRRIYLFNMTRLDKPFYNEDVKINYVDSDTIQPDNLPLYLNRPTNSKIKNEIFYTINDEDFHPTDKMLMKDFLKDKDIYYEKYDPNFSIILYKISVP